VNSGVSGIIVRLGYVDENKGMDGGMVVLMV
jgi:hypothetical protein